MRFFGNLSKTESNEKISVIVITYNMSREAPRTLYSLSRPYQRDLEDVDYEIIVIDNGSKSPMDKGDIESFDANIRYVVLNENAHPSPVKALNMGARMAKGDILGFMIDGARIASPGLLRMAYQGMNANKRAVVATLGWHLGPDVQMNSIRNGYTEDEEDRLLAQCDWRNNGYNLFDISSFAGSSQNGFFRPIGESNAVFMRKALFEELNGFDERFDLPGGGYVNLDFYRRACELPGSELLLLLGEGTFHQMHGGIATNAVDNGYVTKAYEQYVQIRGIPFTPPDKEPIYLGKLPPNVMRFIDKSLVSYHESH